MCNMLNILWAHVPYDMQITYKLSLPSEAFHCDSGSGKCCKAINRLPRAL